MNTGMMPNFLIIGAPKSGTTSLYQYLRQHPEVYMSPVKAPNFFSFYGKDAQFRGVRAAFARQTFVLKMEEYQKLFAGVTSEKAIGEVSPGYMTRSAAENIKRLLPGIKLIAILRHPADRAYSSFMMRVRDGLEPYEDFREAIKHDAQRRKQNTVVGGYIEKGFYYKLLKDYFTLFPREHLKVYLFEDLKDDPYGMLSDLFNFLKVDENFKPDLSISHNASGKIRNPFMHHLWTRSGVLRDLIRPLMPEKIRHAAFEWFIRDLEKFTLDEELRAELVELYSEDIRKLQELLQRDLSGWLKGISKNSNE